MIDNIKIVEIANGAEDGVVLCLPGILDRSAEQYGPMAKQLAAYGRVFGFDYVSKRMDSVQLVTEAYAMMERARRVSKHVALLGSSMGGMQIPFVVNSYRKIWPDDDMSWLKVVIVEAPTGVETMKGAPNWAASLLTSGLARRLLSTSIGDKLVAKMSDPPKDRDITHPSSAVIAELSGSDKTASQWNEWVRSVAIAGLSGYSGSLWISWMIRVGRDGSLARVCRTLQGIDTTYLACIHPGNNVVAQPQARDWWVNHVDGIRTAEVHGTHCGYLQNQPEFAEAFEEILLGR